MQRFLNRLKTITIPPDSIRTGEYYSLHADKEDKVKIRITKKNKRIEGGI